MPAREIEMPTIMIRLCLALAIVAAAVNVRSATAQAFLDQDWLLNPAQSNVYMQTVKANSVIETHKFTALEGNVSKDGDASIRIDMASIETGVDLRNVRLRFLLFEVYKFPKAEISAKLDKAALKALATETRVSYPLKVTVSMHGIVKELQAQVWITRVNESTVSVATSQPIIVTAETFGFVGGIAKLSASVGGTLIAPTASITFDLSFGTGSLTAGIVSAQAAQAQTIAATAAAPIAADACETRMSVISQTGAIYFKTGSAELDRESEPLLDSGADIASRCQAIKLDIQGHTDNVGPKGFNQQLSELRAKSVVDYLLKKGVNAAVIQSSGYGDTRPVAANDSEANRAKNRRIEFTVTKVQ
jgi:OOP family OmpA-OmpF porin